MLACLGREGALQALRLFFGDDVLGILFREREATVILSLFDRHEICCWIWRLLMLTSVPGLANVEPECLCVRMWK